MQKQCLDNNCYNTIHQLSNTLEFLYRADRYIEDAKKVGDNEAEKVWKRIKADRENHADMLKDLVASETKDNRF